MVLSDKKTPSFVDCLPAIRTTMTDNVSRRYCTPDKSIKTLARRVAKTLGPLSIAGESDVELAMVEGRFWPAGNILLAGVAAIRPNCCIFPPVRDTEVDTVIHRACNLWAARIGIGFDLGQCVDPVHVLGRLSRANASVKMPMDEHRPQRGNMATIPISHPCAKQWATCKDRLTGELKGCYNFNISLTVSSDAEWENAKIDGTLAVAGKAAHASGDPGLVFIDRIREETPYCYDEMCDTLGDITTVVPCGEQGMHPDESCTLGAMNLASRAFWSQDKQSEQPVFHSKIFRRSVRLAIAVLDRAQLKQDYAQDIHLSRVANNTRRIGLGVMGWFDLIRAFEKSGRALSEEARAELVDDIGTILMEEASKVLDIHLAVTCIQPTGGITLLTHNKGFALEPYMNEATRYSPQQHIDIVAEWQPYIDNCISKTVNLPREANIADVVEAMVYSREGTEECKVISFYRDGSHEGQQPFSLSAKDAGETKLCRSEKAGSQPCD